MKQLSSSRSVLLGFCAAAVVAPVIGAAAAYLTSAPPSASAAPIPAINVPTPRQWPVETPQAAPLATATASAPLRAVAAIAVLPTPIPTVAPTEVVPAAPAPPSVATHARMLGFVWNGGNVRVGPGLDQPITGSVDAGDLVELLEQQGDWWHIRTITTEGWLSKTLLIVGDIPAAPEAPAPAAPGTPNVVAAPEAAAPAAPAAPAPQPAPVAPVAASVPTFGATMLNGGNVRSGPGLGYTIIGNFHAGTAVEVQDIKAGWWRVRIGTLDGWMSGTLLKLSPQAASHWNVPAIVQAPTIPTAKPAPMQAATETQVLWSMRVNPGQLNVLPGIVAPKPRLVADAVGPFLRARTRVLQASGVDYLGRLDDVYRDVAFETSKPGVASMSWHKAGRAIDVAQYYNVNGVQGVVFARDAANPRYYRVLIRCARQDGSLGMWYRPRQGYYVDVTAILLDEGFQRIAPAGNVSEAWHYEYRGGLKWSQAMRQLYPLGTLKRLYPGIFR